MPRKQGAGAPILYLSRDGILDGLGESQIMAYLQRLAEAHRVWLLTFEKSPFEPAARKQTLAAQGITWRPRPFRGREAPFRAALDVLHWLLLGAWLVLRHRIPIIHARGYIPCALALAVRVLCLGRPRVIFDMRGFWVDERAEVGQWSLGSRAYRLGKWLERLMLRQASAIVTLNSAARDEVRGLLPSTPASDITVIPTCVDTERFRVIEGRPHGQPATGSDRLVFAYTGASGYWQDPDSLAAFFGVVRQERADAAFVCLVRTGAAGMRRALAREGLGGVSRVEEAVPSEEIPRWLAAADVGVIWYRPTYSRLGNFPTKLGEYLACGLPVIMAGAVADSAELVRRERVGTLLREFSPAAYREALAEVLQLVKDPEVTKRCRAVAERQLSLDVGVARYRDIYSRLSEQPQSEASP